LRALRWRRKHKASAQNINRDISVWPNPPALTVMAIPGLEMTGARSRDQWSRAVAVHRVGKNSFVLGVAIQRRDAVAPAAHEANGGSIGELVRDLAAAD